jgi:hypothetical protein
LLQFILHGMAIGIKTLAGLSLYGKFYKIASLASSLGELIKDSGKILHIVINWYIRNKNYEKNYLLKIYQKYFLNIPQHICY